MAVKESRGDRQHLSKPLLSIFEAAKSSCSSDYDAFITHWDASHVHILKSLVICVCVCVSLTLFLSLSVLVS